MARFAMSEDLDGLSDVADLPCSQGLHPCRRRVDLGGDLGRGQDLAAMAEVHHPVSEVQGPAEGHPVPHDDPPPMDRHAHPQIERR